MKEIVQGVDGVVRFALKFYGLRSLKKSNQFVNEGITRAIYVEKDLIIETNTFEDMDDFHIYTNYCGNVFVDTSSDEEKVEKKECEVER